MESSRKYWADYAKAFSILCVVLHHTQISEPMYNISYLLCLPAFFFVSGLFAPEEHYLQFLKKRSCQLLLPYLCFGILSYLVWLFIGRKVGDMEGADLEWWQPLYGLLIGTRDSLVVYHPLWFLPCLFVVENIAFVFHHIFKDNYLAIALAVLVSVAVGCSLALNHIVLPWGITTALIMVAFYCFGRFFTKKWESFFMEISCLGHFCLFTLSCAITIGLCAINPDIEISQVQFGNQALYLVSALMVIFTWTFLGMWIDRMEEGKPLPILATIGSCSLIIYGLHIHCFSLIKAVTLYVFRTDLAFFHSDAKKWLLIGLTFLILYPICLLYQRYKKA